MRYSKNSMRMNMILSNIVYRTAYNQNGSTKESVIVMLAWPPKTQKLQTNTEKYMGYVHNYSYTIWNIFSESAMRQLPLYGKGKRDDKLNDTFFILSFVCMHANASVEFYR